MQVVTEHLRCNCLNEYDSNYRCTNKNATPDMIIDKYPIATQSVFIRANVSRIALASKRQQPTTIKNKIMMRPGTQ
ncbi:hypothetical protein RSAG8_08772, partial [Rhizoctonia solani AG-8 WAC10335]